MRLFCFILLIAPAFVAAQDTYGVEFSKGQNWQQLLSRAKSENKFIFMDCYTSWCEPCKMMDKEVYNSEKLGSYMNKNFISVKVQFDSTARDKEDVKMWYGEMHGIMQRYHVFNFPTFLFFSPDGQIVHRGQGYQSPQELIRIAEAATQSDKQYYSVLARYRDGKRDYESLGGAAKIAYDMGDTETAAALANDYVENYLMGIDSMERFSAKSIGFISSFLPLLDSKGKWLSLFYPDGRNVDAVMQSDGFARDLVERLIANEEILPNVEAAKRDNRKPAWRKMGLVIKHKYSAEYSDRTILTAEAQYYEEMTKKYNKGWNEYLQYGIRYINQFSKDTTNGFIDVLRNNFAYNTILFHSEKKRQIKTAIRWLQGVVRRRPEVATYWDTYASLLYKNGNRGQAISLEKHANSLDPKDKGIQETLEKMQLCKPM